MPLDAESALQKPHQPKNCTMTEQKNSLSSLVATQSVLIAILVDELSIHDGEVKKRIASRLKKWADETPVDKERNRVSASMLTELIDRMKP